MMDGILTQRVTPLLKCVVLFLFIFTAKVLTSRPYEALDERNSITQVKPSHYVRTFTKYHHRRTTQRNLQDWLQEHPKVIQKRSVDALDSNEFIATDENVNFGDLSDRASFEKAAIGTGKEPGNKNGVSNVVKKYRDKPKVVVTEAPTTKGPTISCFYKTHSIGKTEVPSYDDEKNAQLMVENESFENGPLSEMTMPSGEVVQVEQCNDPLAYCYTLWRMDDDGGNITVLGQGCWRASRKAGRGGCDSCTRAHPRLPGSKFCCCTKSYCNADFTSLQEEEIVPIKAQSTVDSAKSSNYNSVVATGTLALLAALLVAVMLHRYYCRPEKQDVEKGDVMGSGPDSLATGLLCVDNLTLIEHIGQGKFGSVWRGSLGSTPVAVKLYSNANAWQREASIYALPHLAHPNILRYYGSDSRTSLTEAGSCKLVVLELCASTLRQRLQAAPLCWRQFALLAHGTAAALAHLHTASGSKPCIVHRDVNSNNVLVSMDGRARLADLGLGQLLGQRHHAPTRLTEAGTLRYLAPEALEGALDLSTARAALCAVDVFALGLVLWEMLHRTSGAHNGPTPPYSQPYSQLPPHTELHQLQTLVARNKVRPPLPRGPVPEARALKIAADTCDECWDHDAEARLTAVCVEERMAELKQMLQSHGPVIHDNNLHPHAADTIPPTEDKNSNCTAPQCDVTTPLLYPHPHIGRNACIERNTHTTTTHAVQLIHKSLKDITDEPPHTPEPQENCLSVARITHRPPTHENSDRLDQIRSYQRPLEYVQNDVSSHEDRGPKQTNLLQEVRVEKPKWGIRKFFENKLKSSKVETEVKLADSSNSGTKISVVNDKPSNVNFDRPSNLVLNQDRAFSYEVPCLSPPNRTLSPTMMLESDMNRENNVFGFKELPQNDNEPKNQNQIFAVIVPKAKPTDFTNLIEMRSKNSRGSSDSIKNSVRTSISSQSIFKSGHSESEDSTVKKRLSCDNRILPSSGRSSRASINLELQYMDGPENFTDSPFDLNSDCSSSEDEHLMLLSENGGSKITMQTIQKEPDKRKYQNEVLKEASQTKPDFTFNKQQNKYSNFDNEISDQNDKENLSYTVDNPVYLASINGEFVPDVEKSPKSPKPSLKNLTIKRQHSLEHVSEIFSSSGDINLLNPAGRVKTPGDLPVAIRRARRDRALQKGRASECNRLSLYDDRMMFGNSL